MAAGVQGAKSSKRAYAGFFSSASTFSLPIGEHFDADGVRGYYIDMRVKAPTPIWRPDQGLLHVVAAQRGLGCFERYVAGEGDVWLRGARECADSLAECQHPDGPQAGGFLHWRPLAHTFVLRPPWISAMAQGEAASLLVRVFRATGEERYADAARRALAPLEVDAAAGGARARLDGMWFPEEYPTKPPSFVLNGAIFALWGVRDVGVGLDDARARAAFAAALDGLAENVHRWDLGYWSRYDLFPHPVVNVASSFYHDLHINQLRALSRLAPPSRLAETADRWAGYAASSPCRLRAFANKALFRLLVPRNRSVAKRVPWSPLRGVSSPPSP